MIKMILLTGFLGAGKTTLLKHLLDYYKNTRVGLIVNEFGEVNIDARLLEEDGITISELSNGSIFCACIKENFLKALIEVSSNDIEYLFIEASGLADPSNMNQIVDTIKDQTVNPYQYAGSICILDGEAFIELNQLLPAVQNQLTYAGAVVVNKEDLIDSETKTEIQKEIKKVNTTAPVYFTSYCKIDIEELASHLTPSKIESRESSNTIESRPQTFILNVLPDITMEQLNNFLDFIAPYTYRIKGFATIDNKNYSVSGVRSHIMIMPWASDITDSEIVLISSMGIGLTGIIANGIQTHAPSLLTLK